MKYFSLVMIGCLVINHVYSQTEDIDGVFEKKALVTNGYKLNYYTFRPQSEKPSTGYPLVLALHGTEDMIDLGGEGSHLVNRENVKGWTESTIQTTYKPYILAPQVSLSASWNDQNVQNAVDNIIQELISSNIIDKNRIYIVGHSVGGAAAWLYPINLATKFAAIAPMSSFWFEADLTLEEAAKRIFPDVSIWNFHHYKDPGSGVLDSRNIINTLEANGIDFIVNAIPDQSNLNAGHIYTEYTENTLPCSGVTCHQICDVAVKDPIFVEWLFSQHRNDPDAIKITEMDTISAINNISWIAGNDQDSVAIYFKVQGSENWILLGKIKALAGKFNFDTPIPAISSTGMIRLDIFSEGGAVYGSDQSGVVTLKVELVTAVEQNQFQKISLYPNPVHTMLYIKGIEHYPAGIFWRILDLQGKEVIDGSATSNTIALHFLPAGTYIFEVIPKMIMENHCKMLLLKQ